MPDAPPPLPPSAGPIHPWYAEFHSFTVDHVVALAWTLPLIVVSCWLGRRWIVQNTTESISREKQLCSAWAGFIVCVNLWSIFYWLQPEHFDIRNSLPLQMCDIGALLAPLLFLTHWRPIRAILYFWGIGLSTQAFISPVLKEGIAEPRYWIFWLGHLAIVGSAVYDLYVRRFRPTIRDFITTTLVTIGWYAAMGFLNVYLGSNYGYNGAVKPDRPTVIDSLGPWPARVYILAAIAIAWFGVLWVIWPLADRVRGRTRVVSSM